MLLFAFTITNGYGSKLKTIGTTDVSLFWILTIQLLGYQLLTHTQMIIIPASSSLTNMSRSLRVDFQVKKWIQVTRLFVDHVEHEPSHQNHVGSKNWQVALFCSVGELEHMQIYSHHQIGGKVNHQQISRDLLFHFGDDYILSCWHPRFVPFIHSETTALPFIELQRVAWARDRPRSNCPIPWSGKRWRTWRW